MDNDQPKGKKITLDDLAAMVQRGFAKMDARFDNIEKILLAKQEKRIEELEAKMEEVREALALK